MVEVPILQEEFAQHLAKYRVKPEIVFTIAENIAEVGGATVFEEPEVLNEKLATWSQYIGATLRKQILDHWFAKKGVPVPDDIAKKFSLSTKEVQKAEEEEKARKKVAEGEKWTVGEDGKIRIAAPGETAISLDEAKRAVKEITKVSGAEEPIVVFNAETGRHFPNFRSEFARTNTAAAWATARTMDKAMAEGEEVDPIEAFVDSMARLQTMREVAGIPQAAPPKEERPATLTDIVSAMRELKLMAEAGEKGTLPQWMTDPLEFNRMIKELTPGESEESRALREQIKEMSRAIEEMREQRLRDEIASYKGEVARLSEKVGDLTQELRDSSRAVGSTSIDLLRDIAGKISDKVPDKRDIRELFSEAVGKRPVLRRRGPAERDRELDTMAVSLETEASLRDIEDFWLFGER